MVEKLDGRPDRPKKKLRMPGGQSQLIAQQKQDWTAMINNGEPTLGEPCCRPLLMEH